MSRVLGRQRAVGLGQALLSLVGPLGGATGTPPRCGLGLSICFCGRKMTALAVHD